MNRILNLQRAALGVHPAQVLAAFSLALLCLSGVSTWAASPDLSTSVPRGGQRGTDVKVTFYGNRLDDAQEVIFHEPGIAFKDLKVLDAKKVEATLTISSQIAASESTTCVFVVPAESATLGTFGFRSFRMSRKWSPMTILMHRRKLILT